MNWIQKLIHNPPMPSPEGIRDALLSVPEGDRKFVITEPGPTDKKIFSIAQDEGSEEILSICEEGES